MIKHERQRVVSEATFRLGPHIPTWDAGGCGLQLPAWLDAHEEAVMTMLHEHGAVCLRGFGSLTTEAFAGVTGRLCGPPIAYRERTTPRRSIGNAEGRIYSSTEYPRDQDIFLHNENAYASCWPEYLSFYCEHPASTGGETLLADVRRVAALISPELMQRLQTRGLIYRRTFIEGAGVGWQQAFGVATLDELARLCRESGLELSVVNDRVRVEHHHSPCARHPHTRELCWFNHAAFFQADKLDACVAQSLHQLLGPEELPNRILYGDGTSLEARTIAELSSAYREPAKAHSWQENDLVILDNMRYAHGRRPFTGLRSVWVAMANELKRAELLP